MGIFKREGPAQFTGLVQDMDKFKSLFLYGDYFNDIFLYACWSYIPSYRCVREYVCLHMPVNSYVILTRLPPHLSCQKNKTGLYRCSNMFLSVTKGGP